MLKQINNNRIFNKRNPFLNTNEDYLICENYKKIKVKQSFLCSEKKSELKKIQNFDFQGQRFRTSSQETNYQLLKINNPFNSKLNLIERVQQNKTRSTSEESCFSSNNNRIKSINHNKISDEKQKYEIERLKMYGLQCLRYNYLPEQNICKINKNSEIIDHNTTFDSSNKQNSNRYPMVDEMRKNIFQYQENIQQKIKNEGKKIKNYDVSIKKPSIIVQDSIIQTPNLQINDSDLHLYQSQTSNPSCSQNKYNQLQHFNILKLQNQIYFYKQLKNKEMRNHSQSQYYNC